MEKIKLNDGQVFKTIPMGINTNNYAKTREFSFISNFSYGELESAFNTQNISEIEYLSVADQLLKTYTDSIGLKMLSKEFNKQVEDNVIADVFTIVLEII